MFGSGIFGSQIFASEQQPSDTSSGVCTFNPATISGVSANSSVVATQTSAGWLVNDTGFALRAIQAEYREIERRHQLEIARSSSGSFGIESFRVSGKANVKPLEIGTHSAGIGLYGVFITGRCRNTPPARKSGGSANMARFVLTGRAYGKYSHICGMRGGLKPVKCRGLSENDFEQVEMEIAEALMAAL